MAELLRLRLRLARDEIRALDLRHLGFAGSSGYLLNGNSKSKLYEYLDAVKVFDLPYDLFLRKLTYESKLNSFVLFPFVTSVSEYANSSSIHPDESNRTDLLWNLYRKLVWTEANVGELKSTLAGLEGMLSQEARAFGILSAAIADKGYVSK